MLNKTVLITGVSEGLGRALVDIYDQQGWSVIGCARSLSKIKQLQQAYPMHSFAVCDVGNFQSVCHWLDSFKDMPIDLLICNASMVNIPEKLWEISYDSFLQVFQVNLLGVFNFIKPIASKMVAQKEGIIVSISSGWGKSGDALVGPYCSSKFALEGMMQSLHLELPKHVISFTIDPGIMKTGMLKKCQPKEVYDRANTSKYVAEKMYQKLSRLTGNDAGSREIIQ